MKCLLCGEVIIPEFSIGPVRISRRRYINRLRGFLCVRCTAENAGIDETEICGKIEAAKEG